MMSVGVVNRTSLPIVGALQECSDFELNGYSIIIRVLEVNYLFVKLRHASNGNTLIVKADSSHYTILKNGRQVKDVWP